MGLTRVVAPKQPLRCSRLNVVAVGHRREIRSRNAPDQDITIEAMLQDLAERLEKKAAWMARHRAGDEPIERLACDLACYAGVLRSVIG